MSWMLLAVVFLGVVEDDGKQEKPISIKKWLLDAQEICGKYGKGPTKAESDARNETMRDEFAEKMDGRVIEFKVQITEVKWKDGVAFVRTGNELPLPKSPIPSMPLTLSRPELEFNMTQAEATKIKPGDWLTFKGKLKFIRGEWGSIGGTHKAQQMYTVQHKFLGVLYLGTFITTEYECEIDKNPVEERWAVGK